MADKTTKILLCLIAIALWMNVVATLFRPPVTQAQNSVLSSINNHLDTIEDDVSAIANGTCTNDKVC
jgi:hypothetical protein